MKKLLLAALCLPLVACIVGDSGTTPPGDDDGSGSGSGSGSGIKGSISENRTLTGDNFFSGATTIEPGVVVTVSAGAKLTFASGAGIDIKGTLDVQGTSAAKVNMEPATGVTVFGDLVVESGGTLKTSYAVWHNSGLTTLPSSTTTLTDTLVYSAPGDFLKLNGGTFTMTYSQVGAPDGTLDTTHCNFHTSGNALTINVTHSNLVGSPYNLMLYNGGTQAIMTDNNWTCGAGQCNAHIDVDTQPGASIDVSRSFFKKNNGAAPTAGAGATIVANALAGALLLDAGVRP